MSPSVSRQTNGNMAYRNNQNRNRNFGSGGGGGGNYGGGNQLAPSRMGGGNIGMSPWDNQNVGNFGGGNMRQGGGQGMNAQAINLANNLLNNLFRNQAPPSLLDLPRGGNGGMVNRNQRGPVMGNRSGSSGGGGGSGGPINRLNNRRGIPGGFQNRTGVGAKSAPKQGTGGIRKQNAFDRAKKLLAKNATNKKKEGTGDKKAESKESPYANVPNDMFYCHLCKKHMWDANSFENHVKGRTHLMMREGIEESYRLKANMIRQEAKLAEQLKSIELDRLKRMGKSKQRMLEYCTMCDLNFHGHISHHRKSEGHLQLKKFLHPKCMECNKEFATRIDFDTHLLCADHLIKAAEKNTKVGERKRNTLNIQTHEEELKDLRLPLKRKKKPAGTAADGDAKKENEEGGAEDGQEDTEVKKEGEDAADESKEGDDLNDTAEEEGTLPVDPENVILDYQDGQEIPAEIESRLPKYNWTRAVGVSQVKNLNCYECAVCGRFLDTDTTAEVHTRTVTHYRNFVKLLNEKSSDSKIAQKRAAAAAEENERKKRKLEAAEAAKSEDIKTENGEEATEEAGEAGAEGSNELYDPSEATGDDDVEMAENGADEDEEMEEDNADATNQAEDEDITEIKPEVKSEQVSIPDTPAVVVKETPKAETPVKATPTKAAATPAATPAAATPTATTPAAASPATPTAAEATPAKKATPAAKSAAKGGARGGRGRGRYRY